MTDLRNSLNNITAIVLQNRSKASAVLICFAGLGFCFYHEKIKRLFNITESLVPKKPQTTDQLGHGTSAQFASTEWVDLASPTTKPDDKEKWPEGGKGNAGSVKLGI